MRVFITLILMSIALSLPCHGLEHVEQLYPEHEISEAKDKLPNEILEIVDNYQILTGQGTEKTIELLKAYFLDCIENAIQSVWSPVVSIFITIIVCSVMEPLFSGKAGSFPLLLFGTIVILQLALSNSNNFFSEGVAAIRTLYDFSTVLLPCLAGASIAAGASISAGAKYTAAALFMNILLNFSNTFLIPLISVYLSAVIGASVFEQKLLGTVANFIRWSTKIALTSATVIFTAYLNVSGLIASTGDLFATRITKTALSSALPVVGNILSGAASSLVAGAAVLRNSIGVFGLLSVIGILLVPFVHLGIHYFLYTAVEKLTALFPNRRYSELLNGIVGVFGMLLGVIGAGFIMVFLTLISFMQIVGG